MASIAGIVSQRGKADIDCTKQVGKMLKLLRHRGPDNTILRTLWDERGALGAGELILSSERTHATSTEEPPYILFDGKLFNERPEGQTDIHLFAELYEKYEKDCFKYLDGSFTCAIVEKDEEVILARDHVGARPVFFGTEDDNFYFATEMKALADHVRFHIQELPPGHLYSSRKGMREFEAFKPDVPDFGDDLQEAARVLRELLIAAVERRMPGVGAISLSGGLDSSIVAAIAKGFDPNLHLFTGYVESATAPDLENAIAMAEFLGMKDQHHVCCITDEMIESGIHDAVWHLESFDEDCVSGFISNYSVSAEVKKYSNSVLVGEGADELFGGYRMVLKNPKVKSPEQRERLARKLLEISYNTALRRLDRAWYANGVNYRTPYLDTRVVAFSKMVPMAWKIYGEKQIEKYILREAFRDMLPERIANREKLRFAMGTGMDDVMDRMVSDKIDPEEFRRRPKAAYGMPFSSFKELYYYDEFLQMFPPAYEMQTVRWDPFK
jgi:asparagine synthase (glutamine-hydrolysing)